jgi:hypothetical protein
MVLGSNVLNVVLTVSSAVVVSCNVLAYVIFFLMYFPRRYLMMDPLSVDTVHAHLAPIIRWRRMQ